MTDDEYTPLIDREREPKSRIHEELTESARERLIVILREVSKTHKKDALHSLMTKIGHSPLLDILPDGELDDIPDNAFHAGLVLSGDTIHVLTYIEFLVKNYHLSELRDKGGPMNRNEIGASTETPPQENTSNIIDNIREVLISEGILWELEMAGSGGVIKFEPLESEAMGDMDEKIQALAEDEPWDDALKGYNDAFERYLNGDFDDTLVTKLYNSIEDVLQTICVDLEGWTENRDMSHSDYLDILNENDVYEANGITAPELNQLLDALEKMVSKVGNDRKQRHAYHDRAYCTLLIHQVGAYLYFLISRYEDHAN